MQSTFAVRAEFSWTPPTAPCNCLWSLARFGRVLYLYLRLWSSVCCCCIFLVSLSLLVSILLRDLKRINHLLCGTLAFKCCAHTHARVGCHLPYEIQHDSCCCRSTTKKFIWSLFVFIFIISLRCTSLVRRQKALPSHSRWRTSHEDGARCADDE